MSYANPIQITYTTAAITVTAAATTWPMRGPKGLTGRLVDVIARCTTTHVVGVTIPHSAGIGLTGAGNAAAYGNFLPAAMTALTGATALSDLPTTSALGTVLIPADTTVLLTTVAGTGAGVAGAIIYDVVINWF